MLVLAALADPVRREIVELLAAGEVGAGEIAERFPVTRPAVSRHLRVLREAGLVTSEVRAQRRVYRLERAPLAELDAWLERFRPLPGRAGSPASLAPGLANAPQQGLFPQTRLRNLQPAMPALLSPAALERIARALDALP